MDYNQWAMLHKDRQLSSGLCCSPACTIIYLGTQQFEETVCRQLEVLTSLNQFLKYNTVYFKAHLTNKYSKYGTLAE